VCSFIPKIYTKKNKGRTELWNKSNLKNPTKLLEYRRALYAKLKNQTQSQDVEQEWNLIKRTITDAANETIQTQSKKQKNEWWDNMEPEQVTHGTIRKEMKLIECVQGRKKNGLTM